MIGVVIGRFQTPHLTSGHRKLIDAVAKRHDKMLVLIGVRPSPATMKNPLSYPVRERMIRSAYPRAVVLPLVDTGDPKDAEANARWSRAVDQAIETAFGFEKARLYGGRDSFIPSYHGRHETHQLEFDDSSSATEARQHTVDVEYGRCIVIGTRQDGAAIPCESPEWRTGYIAAYQEAVPRTSFAVDIAMTRCSDDTVKVGTGVVRANYDVLLGRRAGDTRWRFPGGFREPTDRDFQAAARRELLEETGMTTEAPLEYVGDYLIDDWRTRGQDDAQTATVLFHAPYTWGGPQKGDDLDGDVAWHPIDIDAAKLVANHRALLSELRKHLKLDPDRLDIG